MGTNEDSEKLGRISWSVYVMDSSRTSMPQSWPLVVFQTREEAAQALRRFKAAYALNPNLKFGLVNAIGTAPELIDRFERHWGPRPRLPIPAS